MVKKILCIILSFWVLISSFPATTYAYESDVQYTNEQKELIYSKYLGNEHMLDSLFGNDASIGYWNMVKGIEQNRVISAAVDLSSRIIEQYPDKQYYAEILANLIIMQEGELAEQIEMQSQLDDLKDEGDYAWEIIDIATMFSGNSKVVKDISSVISDIKGAKEVIVEYIEQAKYYQITIQSYIKNKDFLEAVSKYAENNELREVASELLSANDKLLEKRLEYLTETAETMACYEAKFFCNKLSFGLLKDEALYKNDDTVKWFVDCGEGLMSTVSSVFRAGEFAFRMTMLAGDIGFGTSNTFNRYQEMKVLADIAEAIVKANNKVVIPKDAKAEDVLDDIRTKCNYYEMLLVTHARGEYLLYQLLVNDAGMLSHIHVLFDYFKNKEDTTDSWYNKQIATFIEYVGKLENIFLVSEKEQEELSSTVSGTLTVEQQAALKDALEEVIYYQEYDYNTKDFGEVLDYLIYFNSNVLKDKYGIPIEYYQSADVRDPLGIWEGDIRYQKIDKALMDEYIEKYFHIKAYEDGTQIIHQVSEQVYGYVYEGYYYWIPGDVCFIGNILQIESVDFVGNGKYQVVYDIFEEEPSEGAQVGECFFLYTGTREAVLELSEEMGKPLWSYLSISSLGKLTNREGTEYLEINPEFVKDGEWLLVEGTLQKGEAIRPDESTYYAPIIALTNPIKIYDVNGELIEVDEIGIAGIQSIDNTRYGTRILVFGQEMTSNTLYHYRDMMLMDSIIYLLMY